MNWGSPLVGLMFAGMGAVLGWLDLSNLGAALLIVTAIAGLAETIAAAYLSQLDNRSGNHAQEN